MNKPLDIIVEAPEPTKSVKVFGAFIWVILTFIIFTIMTYVLAQVWPYDNASIELREDIQSDVFTSQGIPVIYQDQPIMYEVDICNKGTDIFATWWLDAYGPVLPGTMNFDISQDDLAFSDEDSYDPVRPRIENLDIPIGDRTFSEQFRSTIYYQDEASNCVENVQVVTSIPVETQTGIYYAIRTDNVYKPNILAKVNNVVTTGLFYYTTRGQEIP